MNACTSSLGLVHSKLSVFISNVPIHEVVTEYRNFPILVLSPKASSDT